MNLFSAPADISSKDLPLRESVRLLGRILGEMLREQKGEVSLSASTPNSRGEQGRKAVKLHV